MTTFGITIPILHDKNDTRLINFLLLIGFTKTSANLHEFLFRKEPATGSGKNVFLDKESEMYAFEPSLSILHCHQNPLNHFWFSFLLTGSYVFSIRWDALPLPR
ncbi:TPA: hypothetical protein RG683_003869 [Morganella morganii]|nr:hypothetical protein [Morganella morganii]HDU8570201.1 hypothetical protein [Morganella morganii]